ncbi:hypothetical protein FEK33_12450 [Nocardia asteroides NBRC 15531]|uniref:Uncharacterized protein n=1 Tax=Nocardia asteroides NBRC 15531 TaxID=1110697 RepID=U5EFW6_NOCAS|nr:hypothetical protein [Nocardia asteroides]TLF66835.1 hypothetical protein FEK33_12450 [Nocardia asteroides NBRC 15531]UGT51920.1 hypothetical protein LT345_15755 [Nocardia asteroides]SFN02336.1 hypothetical protein SAMN05444423_105393 [Nocardia asteroides]VEG35165.1 Uncharacterised protein [Nocardia asteroides]GAD85286.1 hypothetical protein NCAST_30_00560 [Nocardia asteroides NBRC 15531]
MNRTGWTPNGRVRRVIGVAVVAAMCFVVPACAEDSVGDDVADQVCEIVGPVADAVASRLARGKAITVLIIAALTGVVLDDACLRHHVEEAE